MERKLIEAVNVNTRMDVRDRKSGLVNWLTVSPLYLLPTEDSALRALPSLCPPPPFLIVLTPETIVSPSRSSPLYLDIFFVFSLSGSLPAHHRLNWALVRHSILHLAGSLDFWFECSQFSDGRIRFTPFARSRLPVFVRINRTLASLSR